MRAAIYARYSCEMQREASIEDQLRVCRRLIEARAWTLEETYADQALSGASLLRPAYQEMMQDAGARRFDVLVAESVDRLSRDQEHIAALYKQTRFLGIPIVTVAEGEISELHIGLKGTMSALYLKDLAQKTHRGLEGRARDGRSAGGNSYGYRVRRQLTEDGSYTTGERIIDEAEALVISRIFRDYAAGRSPRAIAGALNREGVVGPRGKAWGASTIHGNPTRGTGIINNELYIGRLVWNRQRFVKDPVTARRVPRPNPEKDWVVAEVPSLRIVDQPLWDAVKARQAVTRHATGEGAGRRPERARRARHLFSGLLRCGACGASFTLIGSTRYGCAASRNKGTCDNRRTIERRMAETKVLAGLRDRLLAPDLIGEFVEEYRREYNRLMRERNTARSTYEQELVQVQRRIDSIVEAIADGMYQPSMRAKLGNLEARKVELEELLQTAGEDQPLRLHAGLSNIYRAKVADLTTALNDPDLKTEAMAILRGLISEIRLVPTDDGLAIELVGELAAILALQKAKTPRKDASAGSVTLVAGAGFEPAAFRL
jgi:site-specific DNA recombinase